MFFCILGNTWVSRGDAGAIRIFGNENFMLQDNLWASRSPGCDPGTSRTGLVRTFSREKQAQGANVATACHFHDFQNMSPKPVFETA